MAQERAPVDLLIHPIGELATAVAGARPLYGRDMSKITRIKDAALAVSGSNIVDAGPAQQVVPRIKLAPDATVIDASGKCVLPGFVDPHTHMIYAGDRAQEFLERCSGKTYAEITRHGGGILATVGPTRLASIDELVRLGKNRAARMLQAGTTTCEVKTGYALTLEGELTMLRAILHLSACQPLELIPTFMPAHAFPEDKDRNSYVMEIIEQMIPAAAKLCWGEGEPAPFIDVFCDQGYFSLDEAKRILGRGLEFGLTPKVHADEFENLGAATMAVELGARSADHLITISTHEIDLLSRSNTVAVLLPGTSLYLNLDQHAPGRKMIDHNVAVALGSDFNPGSCHIFAMPLIWALACLHLRLTVEEALTAITVNAAFAAGVGLKVGQLRAGYQADIVICDVEKIEEIPYNLGWNPVITTVKKGKVVSEI